MLEEARGTGPSGDDQPDPLTQHLLSFRSDRVKGFNEERRLNSANQIEASQFSQPCVCSGHGIEIPERNNLITAENMTQRHVPEEPTVAKCQPQSQSSKDEEILCGRVGRCCGTVARECEMSTTVDSSTPLPACL